MTHTVLVCDDEPELSSHLIEQIRGLTQTAQYNFYPAPSAATIGDAVRVLIRRRHAVREGQALPSETCLFDGADIIIIDYDLLHVDDDDARYTGEGVARLARTFADCAIVVVLNQFPESQFDLSLRGHLASHADLNIDVDHVATEGLWLPPAWTGFRPWHWQVLSEAVERQKSRVAAVSQDLDVPVIEMLGMRQDDASRLSDSAFGFIAPSASDFAALGGQTFRKFIDGTSDGKDAAVYSKTNPIAAARFACARIAKWLERELLGPQDVLVDIPHLLQRYPFLVGGDIADIDAWNAAIFDVESLRERIPADFWFESTDWVSRPSIWWRRLETDDEIRAKRVEFDFSTVPDFVFLEDISAFGNRVDAQEFRAGFHNSFDRRFVKAIDGIRYAPQRRFAFGS